MILFLFLDFVAGSRLGLVWHATITLIGQKKSVQSKDHSLSDVSNQVFYILLT